MAAPPAPRQGAGGIPAGVVPVKGADAFRQRSRPAHGAGPLDEGADAFARRGIPARGAGFLNKESRTFRQRGVPASGEMPR